MIRVLHVVPSLEKSSGITSFVNNALRNKESEVQFDFLHFDFNGNALIHVPAYDDEFEKIGARVYKVISPRLGILHFISEIDSFFKDNGKNYDLVHCHVANAAFCVLKSAKKYGIEHRIMHSHLNTSSEHILHKIRNRPLISIGKKYATDYLACSEEAGKYLFGNKQFEIIHNGISLESFSYSVEKRNRMRKELGISLKSPVIGCVGRIVKQKNHGFAIDILEEILHSHPNAMLLIIGDGDYRSIIEEHVQQLRIDDKVQILGNRSDIADLYSAIDVFLMPSLCEGLPFSAVEAQASGVPCIYSTGVPKETDITGTGTFVSLESGADIWARQVIKAFGLKRKINNPKILARKGYSAQNEAEQLINYYKKVMYEKNI